MSTTTTTRTAIKMVASAISFVSPSSVLAALPAGLPAGDAVTTPVGTDPARDGAVAGSSAGDGVGSSGWRVELR